jgi:UDP:flavonoid glycosyltransferase YjiC (YdhE family)
VRLPTYALTTDALVAAVDRVLTDAPLRERCAAAGRRLRDEPGTVRAARLIERIAVTGEPVGN